MQFQRSLSRQSESFVKVAAALKKQTMEDTAEVDPTKGRRVEIFCNPFLMRSVLVHGGEGDQGKETLVISHGL